MSIAVWFINGVKSHSLSMKLMCPAVFPSILLCLLSFLIYFGLLGCDVSLFQSVDVAFNVYPVP